jgi:hypothetical protein
MFIVPKICEDDDRHIIYKLRRRKGEKEQAAV